MKMKHSWLWQCGKNCATLFLLSSSWIVLNPVKASAVNECHQISTSETSPITYVVTSTGGGANTDIVDWGSGGSNEERVTQLFRDYSVTFKCTDGSGGNLTNADIDVDLETITTPSSAPANLDLGDPGITHQVSVGQNTSYTDLKENFTATNDSVDIVSSSSSQPGDNLSLDSDGEITINLRSTFVLEGNAEEFAAGDYSTQFRITATPTSSGTLGSNTTVISKNVEKECSLQNRSEYTETGSPKPYVTTTSSAGLPEPRATRLEASDSVGFDCNTADVDYSVEMTNLTAPIFSNSSNIDLLQGGGSNGVDHKVKTRKIHPSSNTTTELQALTQELTTGIIDQRTGESTDDNGDIEIEVTSRFETTGAAEELGAGDYSATFTVTVTAN
jgi:hypothetical protein